VETALHRWLLVQSPLLGPASWRRTAQVLINHGQRVLTQRVPMTTTAHQDHVGPWIEQYLQMEKPADDLPMVAVGHSAACPRMPLLVHELRRVGWNIQYLICVDGRFPDGRAFTDAPTFGPMLNAMVRPDDYLPPWPRWWGSLISGLVVDPGAREEVMSEAVPIPRSWFDQACPVPDLPPEVRQGYVAFGGSYLESAAEAESNGWFTVRIDGDHLHQVVNPLEVATTLMSMVACMGAGEHPSR